MVCQVERSVVSSQSEPLAKGTYLITGGLGALGWATCEWLMQQGVDEVILVSRHAANKEQAAQLERWNEEGHRVRHLLCDVSDEQAVEALLTPLTHLVGIYHAAGQLDDGLIEDMTAERIELACASKAKGALYLHRYSNSLNLKYFVMYSSVASLLGSAGQLNYCIANSFLDALVQVRRTQGLAATSMHWGPWQGFGMAANYVDKGIHALSGSEYLALLGTVQDNEWSEVGVLKANWDRLSQANLVRLGSLSHFASVKAKGDWIELIQSLPVKSAFCG